MLFLSVTKTAAILPLLLAGAGQAAAETIALGVSATAGTPLPLPHEAALAFPGDHSFHLAPASPAQWLDAATLRLSLFWPSDAPRYSGALVWLKDRDDYWHQYLLPGHLKAGETNTLAVPFHPGAAGWQTPGHSLAWHHRVRLTPQSAGFRVFADATFTGKCVLVSATLDLQPPSGLPAFSKIRALTPAPRAFALYEAGFNLPDRYANPFDPVQIDAGATVTTPSGAIHAIHAFYYQPHYRLEDELGQPVEPDGQPEWRLRYCPREPGEYTVSLHARDAFGETTVSNALRFTAAPPAGDALRFVRVSQKDRRYFEFDNGTLFYPIGHNTRSATDARMDDKFPWTLRKEEGTTAYRRYFQRMQDAGENIAEVWMSSWSLGLEWTEGVSGYHGANDYHMGNAWELDRVIDLALRHRIYLNLVLNYHGRIGQWLDPEWHLHPYNKATPGGWLEHSLDFFSDARAIDMQKRFCRYTQARWGWAPVVLGYELCSEINLTGPYIKEFSHRIHFKPEVVEWCRVLGAYLHSVDPYGHLVSAHISNDHTLWNPALCNLPELDFNPLDAYNNARPDTPEHIINLLVGTADAGAAFNKPALITEFGGSAMAAGLENLKIEQHAALWAGACLPLGGVPMFWWWQVIDENDLYARYPPVRAFMAGVDPRNPAAQRIPAPITAPDAEAAKRFAAVCTASPHDARGYVYPARFARAGQEAPVGEHLTVTLDGFAPGIYRVEFFGTQTGQSLRRFDVRSQDKQLAIPVPKFTSDCAFKLNLLTPVATKP